MFSRFFNRFKGSKANGPSSEHTEAPKVSETLLKESPAVGDADTVMATKTTVKRDAPKRTYSKDASAKGSSTKKTLAKKAPAKGAATKKATAKTKETASAVSPGSLPKELKGFEKELKDYAQHSRMPFEAKTANQVFTEYMAKTFRELGYKMVLIRDQENGIITMLDRERESKGPSDDSVLKSKLVVKCVYMKRGCVDAESIISAQEGGAGNRADETWCITTTDFGEDAVRKSKKKGARVRLYNGQRLYKEFLSKNERDR